MNLELFPAAQNNGAAGGAAAAGRCNGGLGSDAEKSVGAARRELWGSWPPERGGQEAARGRQVPVLNQCQAAAGAGWAAGRTVVARCIITHQPVQNNNRLGEKVNDIQNLPSAEFWRRLQCTDTAELGAADRLIMGPSHQSLQHCSPGLRCSRWMGPRHRMIF